MTNLQNLLDQKQLDAVGSGISLIFYNFRYGFEIRNCSM